MPRGRAKSNPQAAPTILDAHVTDATGADVEKLLQERKLVIIDFYATWCAPCKAYSPKFDRLDREMRRAVPDASVAFVSVDIDREQPLAREANVMSVPTTVAWTLGKGLFGGPKKKELLRYSGDRSWPEMQRTFAKLLETHAR